MTQFSGASIRLLAQLAGSLELPQMPFRQREEVRRAHLRVIAEPEQRFSVSFTDIVAQCPLERLSRGLQISKQERDKTENPASDASFRGTSFGFSFAKKGLGFRMRLAMFATHEARQTLAVVGHETRSSFIGRSGELACARVGCAHFVGGKTLQPHRRMSVVRMQPQAPLGQRRIFSLVFRSFSFRFIGKRDRFAKMRHRLLERRTAQCVFARIGPPFDRQSSWRLPQ